MRREDWKETLKVEKRIWFLLLGIFLVIFNEGIIGFSAEVKLTKSEKIEELESPNWFKFSVDTDIHNYYRLTYPITYQFSVPSHSSKRGFPKLGF